VSAGGQVLGPLASVGVGVAVGRSFLTCVTSGVPARLPARTMEFMAPPERGPAPYVLAGQGVDAGMVARLQGDPTLRSWRLPQRNVRGVHLYRAQPESDAERSWATGEGIGSVVLAG